MDYLIEFAKLIIALYTFAFLFHLFFDWVEHVIPGFSNIKQVEIINGSEIQKEVQKVEVLANEVFYRK